MRNQIIIIVIAVICLIGCVVYYSNELSSREQVIDKLKSEIETQKKLVSTSISEQKKLKEELKDKSAIIVKEKSNLDAIKAELDKVKASLKESHREADVLNKEIDRLKNLEGNSNKTSEASDATDGEVTSESTQLKLVQQLKSEIEKQDIKIQEIGGKLKLSLSNKILFASAQTNLTDEGLIVLERLGHILKGIDNRLIRVEGHTDNLKIRYRLKEKYPSNWELSAARATNVVRFLINKVGIDPKKVYAVGMSKYHPVADNATPKGRSLNRRIEIMLEPIVEVKEIRELQLVDEINNGGSEAIENPDINTKGLSEAAGKAVTDRGGEDEFSDLDEPQVVIENEKKRPAVKRFTVSDKMITTADESSSQLKKPESYTKGHSKGGVGYIWVKKRITDFSSE